jgi:hypothetical protein
MQEPHAVAQDGEAVTGWWSRIMSGTAWLVREVVEFRPDGTYTVTDQFKTGQWLSNQNQPLLWLVKGLR